MEPNRAKPTANAILPADITRVRDLVRRFAAAADLDAVLHIVRNNGLDGVTPCCALLAGLCPDGVVDIWAHQEIPKAVLATAPVPLDIGYPITEAMATRTPIWIESGADRDRWYPGLRTFESAPPGGALLPLEVEGVVFGGLGIFFAYDRGFTERERQHYELLADLTALAAARLRALDKTADVC